MGGININLKNQLLAILLILVFVMSVSAAVAVDASDIAEDLESSDEEAIAIQNEEPLSANDGENAAGTSDDTSTSSDGDDEEITSLAVHISTDKQAYNVGDSITVSVDILNTGMYDAHSVRIILTVPDNLKFVSASSSTAQVTKISDNKYAIDFGTIGDEEEDYAELTFLATAAGEALISAEATGDDFELDPGSEMNATITIEGNDTPNNGNNVQKTMLATGNPVLLLALALCCLIPVYRRK